jgi:hypothetical protein
VLCGPECLCQQVVWSKGTHRAIGRVCRLCAVQPPFLSKMRMGFQRWPCGCIACAACNMALHPNCTVSAGGPHCCSKACLWSRLSFLTSIVAHMHPGSQWVSWFGCCPAHIYTYILPYTTCLLVCPMNDNFVVWHVSYSSTLVATQAV